MNKFFEEQYDNELNYIFNTFFSDLKMISEEKKIEGRPVLASEVLLNNESYTLYKYEGGKLIFVPKSIDLKNDFLPIYYLGASKYGIGLSILTREENLLEKKSYSFIFREESKEVESHFSYMHYLDLNNDLENLFKKENVSLELFLIRKTFNQLLTSTKVRTSINIRRNENETKLNNFTGETEEHFLATINNKLIYDIVDDKKTLFELSNESLSKDLNVSPKIK